jgi:hypothetical protein
MERRQTLRLPEMMQLADKCRQANATDRLEPVLSSFGLLDMHATRA